MDWPGAQERLRGPVFAPVAPVIARLDPCRWPCHEELTALARGITTAKAIPIRFVAPRERGPKGRSHYERRIAETGEIETRAGNWHDLFNALAWMAFPRAKAAINAQHAAILAQGGEDEERRRGPARDALSLFDEGGVVVASSSPPLLRLITDFAWKELFWRRREELAAKVRFFAFGHALLEQALDPFVGMVAKTVFVPVDEPFAMLPPEAQVARADALLAEHFASRSRFSSPTTMAPMPVLGIPGWHPDTGRESFYDDDRHFRRKSADRSGKGSESFRGR